MSVNPLNDSVAPAYIAAFITQELAALAADAQTLATQLLPGDVVPAVVLSSNGLTDLLSVNGLRVAAELPPSLLPGENITVMVTGFDGERINLQIVPTPQTVTNDVPRVPVRPAPLAGATASASPGSSMKAASPPNAAAPAPTGASAMPGATARSVAPGMPPPVAINRAPFGPSPASDGAPGAKPAGAVSLASAEPNRVAPARPGAAPAPPRPPASEYRPRAVSAPIPVSPELKTIEARLAAARATTVPTVAPPVSAGMPPGAKSGPRPAGQPPAAAAVPRPPVGTRQAPNASAPPGRPTVPTAADARSPFGAKPRLDVARLPPAPVPALTGVPVGVRAPAAPVANPTPSAASAAPRDPAAFAEPAALLRALNLPVTSINLALARMALEAPEKLPNALAVLERALAGDGDPRVATLSTLTSFVARIEPRSPVLAAQIAAFVDHVVTGREAKIAQLASAVGESAPPAPSKSGPNAQAESDAPAAEAAGREPAKPGSAERIAVVRAALDFDFKTQLLAVAATRAAAGAATPKATAFDRAVAGTLSAITALQLNAASTLNAHPDGLAFTLPLALPDGFANAHVRIDRNAPDGRVAPLDGDNFHIAFVLETRHLGTVAIDVMTVGRAVTLSVKTEAVLAQRIFATALDRLSARLESLRYRVAKADAAVAPPAAAERPAVRPASPFASGPAAGTARLVDVDA